MKRKKIPGWTVMAICLVLMQMAANADGSVDAYFGPVQPKGVPKENWIQTKPGVGYFVYLRLYGPLESWFDKACKPGDP